MPAAYIGGITRAAMLAQRAAELRNCCSTRATFRLKPVRVTRRLAGPVDRGTVVQPRQRSIVRPSQGGRFVSGKQLLLDERMQDLRPPQVPVPVVSPFGKV
jgi:hypothetical protein